MVYVGERGVLVFRSRKCITQCVTEIITEFWSDFSKDLASAKQWLLLDLYYKHQENWKEIRTIVRLTEDSAVCPYFKEKESSVIFL